MLRFNLRVLTIAVGLLLTVGATIAAERLAKTGEWPTWRGPLRDGKSTETGLLQAWPSDGPELLWQAGGLGLGFSSVSIQNGRVFSMGEAEGEEFVIALDLNGKKLWSTIIGKNAKNGGYAGPRCTPTLDGDLLYAIGSNGDLACLKTATGDKVWAKSLKNDYDGKMMSGWGYSESPLIDGEMLICTPGGSKATLAALNKKTGKEIWSASVPEIGKAGKDGAGYSSVVIGNCAGVKQYIQLLGRGVVGVDAKTGKFLWGYNRTAGGTANITTPVVKDDYVFSTTGYPDGGSGLVKIVKDGSDLKAEEVWYKSAKEFQNHHGGMILLGDLLFGGHGQNQGFPTCLEFLTGNVVWGKDQRGPGGGSAAVAYADGNLYFRYQDGKMALIAASPKELQVKGSFKIPDSTKPSWPHPVIADGKLYLREQDQLLVYNLKK